MNANAVLATNGQTVQEILGSGDATNPALQFTLKQAPLTYLPAPNGNGSVSTLQVWVNNLQWHETASLLTAGPADRVFVTSTNAAGNTVVQFGNGVQGARPPTGMANIRAVYRTGIGSAGMVSAGQLSQPLDRPQGLSSVTNPSAASGAADPATAGQARASAPLPTLTIGRVVSLEDYQNYALGFAGIGMALATWTWFGDVRGVFLTVAGVGGAVLSDDDPVVTGAGRGDPAQRRPARPAADRVVPARPVHLRRGRRRRPGQLRPGAGPGAGMAGPDRRVRLRPAPVRPGRRRERDHRDHPAGGRGHRGPAPGAGAERDGAAARPAPAMLCASGPQPPAGAELLQLDPATQGRIGVWSP